MSRNRSLPRKLRYAKAQKVNRRIPNWILQKSDHGRCRYNNKQHHWSRNHLKL